MSEAPIPETITLRLPSRLELLAVLDRVALTVCERMEFDEDTSSQVSMSVIEAGTNAVQHGHKRDASKFFETEFRLFTDRLEVDVRDEGGGFDVTTLVPDVTIPEHLLEREETAGTWSDRGGVRPAGAGPERRGAAWRGRAVRAEGASGRDDFGGDDDTMHIPAVTGGRSANSRNAIGKRVLHEKFGAGTVVEADGDGPDMKLTVRFTGTVKKVLARFVSGAGDGD